MVAITSLGVETRHLTECDAIPATPARVYAEMRATRTMLNRIKRRLGIESRRWPPLYGPPRCRLPLSRLFEPLTSNQRRIQASQHVRECACAETGADRDKKPPHGEADVNIMPYVIDIYH